MPNNESRALAAMLLGHYPGSFVTEMNVLALADTFERLGLDVVPEIVERAKVEFTRPPSSAQLYEIAGQIRRESEREWREPALQSAVDVVGMPDDIRERIVELFDPGRKRERREAEVAEENADWERKKQAARFVRRVKTCDGTGRVPVERGGKLFCPDCGVEIPDIVVQPVPKVARRKSWKTGELA